MMMMYDQDSVLRFSAQCADAHGTEVSCALTAYVREPLAHAAAALRVALVAQVAGHESTAHDGSERAIRVSAARAALDAWDGSGPIPDGWVTHDFAGTTIRAPERLWRLAGYIIYRDGTGKPYVDRPEAHAAAYAEARLASAMAEGLQHERALLRAIQMGEERSATANILRAKEIELKAAEENSKAAGLQFAAEKLRRSR
jgi:hypothetical protein